MLAPPARFGDNSKSRRVAAIAFTLVLHGLAVLTVLLQFTQTAPARSSPSLTTFDTAKEAAAHPTVHRTEQPQKVIPPPPLPFVAPPPEVDIPRISPVVAAMLDQAEAQASAGGCDLTAPVQAALQASDDVRRTLPAVPPDRRSVATAIAIWDQRWVQPDALLDARTLSTIRDTIIATIAAASPACRSQSQGGPRLLYVPVQSDTTVLAVGSGQWTWQQVADSAQADLALAPDHPPLDPPRWEARVFGTTVRNP